MKNKWLSKKPSMPVGEPLNFAQQLVVMSCLVVSTAYIGWRATSMNADAPVFSAVLYGAEVFGYIMTLLHFATVWRLSVRKAAQPPEHLSVDVFIPTINEPLSTVRRTALAAIAMDYRHKVWILDDGRREEMKRLAATLNCGYIARDNNLHAKAGNLNHALARTQGEFIAIFDADHAPKKSFLMRTLGYFNDSNVAFVQAPQEFYNLDSYQHRLNRRTGRMWTEQALFFRVIQRGKDMWNAAFFCGSCAVIRRSHLEEIGGFATGTVAEDLHTSLLLHKKGYRSVYHDEPLAFGIAADQIEGFYKQRLRWGRGAMQIWRKESILFGKGLTLMQRLLYFCSVGTYFTGWQKLVFFITPPLVLLTGWLPVQAEGQQFFTFFLPYLALNMLAFSETSRGFARSWYSEQYHMAAFAALASSTLGYFKRHIKFSVTSKRFGAVSTYWKYLIPQLLISALCIAGIAYGAGRYAAGGFIDAYAFAANVFWAGYTLTMALLSIHFACARAGFRRQDYRFRVPLVATFTDAQGQEHHATVRDISATGLRLQLPETKEYAQEETIRGRLFLPDGPLPFTAMLRTTNIRKGGMTLGARFQWEDTTARNRVERFLYGTDIEWRIHGINDRAPTLLDRVLTPLLALRSKRLGKQPLSMLYTATDATRGTPLPGVIALNRKNTRAQVALFTPLPKGTSLETRVLTLQGWKTLRARIANENWVDSAGASLYHCELEEAFA